MSHYKFGTYRIDDELLEESVIKRIEREYNLPIEILSFYRAWNYCNINNDKEWIKSIIKKTNREILLTYEPWNIFNNEKVDQKEFRLKNIIRGKFDKYLTDFFKLLIPIQERLYLRPMHEMNGNWYPWCGTVNENSPRLYKDAFRYIKNIADSISFRPKWIFCPYVESVPNIQGNSFEDYYPGDYYVDYLGLDGYNWGTEMEWSSWKSFEEVFGDAIDKIARISDKPIIISEVATTNRGGDKASWINNMFETVNKIPKIFALIWFDVQKECDWRFNK